VRLLGARVVLEQAHPVETLLLKRWKPDYLLIDANPQGEPLEEHIRRIKAVSPWVKVAVIHGSQDPEVILGAMRAGADEFVMSPIGDKLNEAFSRFAAQMARRDLAGRPAGKLVAFVSAQGGCGATTVACHLAAEFQRAKRQDILLADLDLESGLVAFLMQAATQFSVLDAVKNLHRLDQSFWKGLVSNGTPYLDVIPAPTGLTMSEAWDPTQFHDVFKLIRSLYGMVILDLGRTLNPMALMLLDDLDELYLVTTPSITALYQTKRFIQRALQVGFPRHQLLVVLNRVPKPLEFQPGELEQTLGVSVCAELPDRPELEEAYRAGELLPPNSVLGKHFSKLALKMTGVKEEAPRKLASWFGLRKPQPGFQEG
jgi:pilus assembly protein CpaE